MEVRCIKARDVETLREQGASRKKKYAVAAYCRVSTDDPDQKTSYDSQISYYTQMVAEHDDWELVDVYADEAITGTIAEKRPGFVRLINDCREGRIDLVIMKSISRFARNVQDVLRYVRELQSRHIAVIFEEEKINTLYMDGELLLSILSAVYQQEVENISAHVKKGLRMKMERGELVGYAACLGFDYDKEKKILVINEEEAEIVRYIFKRYIEGAGANKIAKELEALGKKTKRGGTSWVASTVNNIIRNEKYIGDLLQGKTYVTNPITKKRRSNKGEVDRYSKENTHEAIISREDFNLAQQIRTSRGAVLASSEAGALTRFGRRYAFSHMVECGYCHEMYVRRYQHTGTCYAKAVWKCGGATREGRNKCPHSRTISEKELEQLFLSSYNKVNEPGNKETQRMLGELVADNIDKQERGESIGQLDSKIEAVRKKISTLVDMHLDEVIVEEDYLSQYDLLRKQIDELEQKRKNLVLINKSALTPAQRLRRMMDFLAQEPQLEEFNREHFEAVIEKVVIGIKDENGHDMPNVARFFYVNGVVDDVIFKGAGRAEKHSGHDATGETFEINEERAAYGLESELTEMQKKSLNSMLKGGVIDRKVYNETAERLVNANRLTAGFTGG